jgi:uncharacterized protein YdeI (YjbR/CyaY-like superfamily)
VKAAARKAPAKKGKEKGKEKEKVPVETRRQLRAWLARNHGRAASVWLVLRKKSPERAHLSYNDVVEEALCYGWVDSKPAKLDAERFMLTLSPRNPKSAWSKINKARIAKLMKAGLLAPPGLAKVAAAKRNGAWNALDAVEALRMPADFSKALAADAIARKCFEAFSPSARKIILGWILGAKRPGTRAQRIAEAVALAAKNIKANHWRQ